jgi:ADP-ribose pyrophosphatase YjhB (NUDIX family)
MKKFYAWLLLTVSTCQWIGGHVYFEVSYFIEIEHRMDEAEQAIAKTVKEETGVDASVKILQETQITPRGYLYSDFFAFSKTVDDETVYFTLSSDSSAVTFEQITHQQQPRQDQEEKAAQLNSLHQDFMIPLFEYPAAKVSDAPSSNFQLSELHHHLFISLLTPPPDAA